MKCLRIISILLLVSFSARGQETYIYRQITGWGICREIREGVVCLRKFSNNGKTFFFTLSPSSLQTRIIPSDSIFVMPVSWDMIDFLFSETPYLKALKQAEILGNNIQDAGFTRFNTSTRGIELTIDLCPSKLPLDRIVFTDLISEMGRIEKPVPLAICITGKWIETHQRDLLWLDSLVKAGNLSVLWVNHSYNHFTYRNTPLIKNFLLAPGTDINAEVLNNEKALLQRNIVPSIFFRFPGLISDRDIYNRILSLGLIPLGSDAWLAKGQKPGNGSIVLIHANGNEPVGVRDFINLLKRKQKEVISGRWELFDLRESLIEDKTVRPGF
jgi:hypothetical protein